MSEPNTTDFIIYEYPLNEKTRSWLRLETLLQQVYELSHITSYTSGVAFFRSVSELIEILDRGEIRSDLIKDLEKHRKRLATWAEVPNVDNELITILLKDLADKTQELISAPRFGQKLRSDKIISMVRQRLSIPGGCCSFDLPAFQLWLNMPQEQRDNVISSWLQGLQPLKDALDTILNLLRQSGSFETQEAHNGFYQDIVEDKELLRVGLPADQLIFPQISGHKTRFAIRFLHIDSENGIVPAKMSFELSCC
ncbi:cell division protein ZapD [Providencia sneebia]|uniref:Cell division protein ZapD n=1 Tax=Providencia sneebia DSM 19967 TaxID=1141660 RepID=K8W5X1_9GAMM|nr:cell division protein ZapD [Providencia sneebia]EKT55914.1 hypothetical protein OO7_13134 [Providencia sneebia DSM 19967]